MPHFLDSLKKMNSRIALPLAGVAIFVCPAWAIRPENQPSALRLMRDRGAIAPPPAAYISRGAETPYGPGLKSIRSAANVRSYRDFTTRTGQNWFVRWNPITDAPELVTGKPYRLTGAARLTAENIEPLCCNFVSENADLLRVRPDQLQLAKKAKAASRWFVTFRQAHKGVPVLGGQLKMSFTPDDRLMTFGSEIYPDVAVDTEPNVDSNQAVQSACSDCGQDPDSNSVSEPQLCILPLYRPDRFEYRLCWRFHISQPQFHQKWQYLIDAATGRIISKTDALVYQNITGAAQLEFKPEFADDPIQSDTFPYGNVTAAAPEIVIAAWNFDTDPGWATQGEWAFGPPSGGGFEYCPDPNSAYTGDNVYGYNLDGDYGNLMPVYYLTTTAINCSSYENVHLKFMRWLGVESLRYDYAAIEVSNDGANWTTIWRNDRLVRDKYWHPVSYDISEIAAFEPTVYIRWAMGPTDGYVAMAGWNIDDMKVVSCPGWPYNTTQTGPDGFYSVTPTADPTILTSELNGAYCNIEYACGPDALLERPGVHPSDVVDFTWNSSVYNELVEPSVYRHVNYVHDYFLAIDPNLGDPVTYLPAGLNYPMPVTVQQGCENGYCNAYWDGRGITLGAGDGSVCDDFGLYSEVIYHEYTHGVTWMVYADAFLPYAMESGALNEAWSDYFGCVLSPSQSPRVGDGGLIFDLPDGFRSLDNAYRREKDFRNEVHFDSQTVSGSLWQARKAIGHKLDAERWDEMVHFARYAHAQTFEQYLLALLAEDDIRYGDGCPANATPHAKEILDSFADHGIGGLQYLAPSIIVDDASGNANGKLDPGETAGLSLSLTNDWADATGISAILSSSDPFVKIKQNKANFPDVAYAGTTNNAAALFIVSLEPDCPRTHTIDLALRVTAEGPYIYSRTCLLTYAVAVDQLAYDDGQNDNLYIGYGGPRGALAVRMTPQSYPSYLTRIRLVPYPGMDSTIELTIWDDDGPDGLPGTVLAALETDVPGTGDWFDVGIASLGLKIDDGSFYVGWVEDQKPYYNAIDMDPPYHQRSWLYLPYLREWLTFTNVGFLANLMVRVECVPDLGQGPVENTTSSRKYDTIQQAIDDAYPGDEIVVDKGAYYENVDFTGKRLTLSSTNPNDPSIVKATIINGACRGPAVSFCSGEDQDSILQGFTIMAAESNTDKTGGICCINLGQTGPTIMQCIIAENSGPGIYNLASSPNIVNCIITKNRRDGIESRADSRPVITNCIIAENTRHGVFGGSPKIANCTITKNAASGIFNSQAVITNSIVCNNLANQIKGSAQADYCNIQGGWPGLGNIDADPCFVEPNLGDYHLKSRGWRWDRTQNQWTWDDTTSRCIDAGNPGTTLGREPLTLPVDPLNRFGRNLRTNMGAYGRTQYAGMPPYDWAILADLTNDGILDSVDLVLLADSWLNAGSDLPADVGRNNIVDMPDFAWFAADWLSQTTWSP